MSWLYLGYIIAFLLFSMELQPFSAVDYKLDGDSYITYIPAAEFPKTTSTIHMLFRTAESFGVLLHARGTNDDFITLEIVRGKLRYVSVFGRGSTRPGTYDYVIGDDLGDNEWHQLDIERNKNLVVIKLDITRQRLISGTSQIHQNTDDYITVAGLPASIKDSPSITPTNTSTSLNTPKGLTVPPVSLTRTLFKGCMADVTFNKVNIFEATKKKAKEVQVFGNLWPKCAPDAENYYPPATFTKSTSFIKLDTLNGQHFDLGLKFRTFDHTGVLIHYRFGLNSEGNLLVELLKGEITFSYAFENVKIKTILSPKLSTYASGVWHKVKVNFTSNKVDININNATTQTLLDVSRTTNITQNAELEIGTSSKDKPSLQGCVKEIQVNGKHITVLKSNTSKDVVLDQCYLKDLCFKSPCLHQGVCKQHNYKVQCDCTNTSYSGSRCENISALHQPNATSTRKPSITMSSGKLQTHNSSQTTVKTIRPSTTSTDKSSLLFSTQSTNVKSTRNLKQTSTVRTVHTTMRTKRKQLITTDHLASKQVTTGESKHFMSSTSSPEQVVTRTSKKPSGKPDQPILTDSRISTTKPKQFTTTRIVTITTSETQDASSPKLTKTSRPQLTTPQHNLPTRPSALPTHLATPGFTQPTRQKPTQKRNTQIIIIEKSNTITNYGINKNQILVYLFLLIIFLLFIGLIVIISVKMSYLQACSCLRRFQTVNGSIPRQDSIELGPQGRKESGTAVRVKTERPSSFNDSGIDRSESGTNSHRSSAEVQDEIPDSGDLATSLENRGELSPSSDDSNEGFLILQEDPTLYTQRSFGWTVLNGTNTIRHCRTSTSDLIHASNENKPRAFRPAYYPNSEISDVVRVEGDVKSDKMKYRNPTTKYRQLTTSDTSSSDDMPPSPGFEANSECQVF
ncbi:contactin-associated protein-like 2 [Dendronephthya gigantea]|uniref:contactin-associated protein-like 2 n=1 Tax=Dendronephthya gigantea TaxID=151771 RepID=UPI00106B7B10|nr:contactin-associated protein-like 2 [Dendronephthya gigantea]XP_028392015.1 contactin-associated protein-like 2 [Dendronephthya gigantea]